jgi:hypothetical protein
MFYICILLTECFFLILTNADDKAFFFSNDIAIDFYLVLAAISWLAVG